MREMITDWLGLAETGLGFLFFSEIHGLWARAVIERG